MDRACRSTTRPHVRTVIANSPAEGVSKLRKFNTGGAQMSNCNCLDCRLDGLFASTMPLWYQSHLSAKSTPHVPDMNHLWWTCHPPSKSSFVDGTTIGTTTCVRNSSCKPAYHEVKHCTIIGVVSSVLNGAKTVVLGKDAWRCCLQGPNLSAPERSLFSGDGGCRI